jgi:phytol kinase
MNANPYFAGTLLIAGLVGWMSLLRVYQRLRSPNPECLRKLVHVPGGLLAVSLPFLFSDSRPLLFTCGLFLLILVVVRSSRNLRQGIGAVLCSVARRSNGELWFPVSIAFLFVLSHGDFLLYSIPLLILTFADAAAALVGTRYGEMRYANGKSTKTFEGSLTFFVVALLTAGIPLALTQAQTDSKAILIAFLLALALSVTEGVCRNGLDNLVVPVAGFYLLHWLLILSTDQLVLCLAMALALTAGAVHHLTKSRFAVHAVGGIPQAR